MQENRNVTLHQSNKTRNNVNNGAISSKKTVAVAKRADKKVAKRNSNLHAVRAPRIVNVKKENKAPFPWSVVFVAVLLTGMFLFMMMNYAEVDKYRSEITNLNNKVATMEKTQDELEVTLGNKYDIGEIDKYAENELGMTNGPVPEDKLYRVNFEQEDRTEMHTYDDGEEGGFGFLLAGLGEVIRDFMD